MAGAHSFGRYKVTGTLGVGAMGEVYAAVDDVLGREVAVKTLRSGVSGLGARLLDERFRLEARAIASLSHPGVVQVFDIDLTGEPPYLVMERVAGPSLKEILARGPLALDELRALGIQIARALAAAHAAGVVHRDVKPANVLAAGAGAWKLADFGVAHMPDSSLTWTGQFVGSPAYAPPEALVRGEAGPPGDVYALAATLYQAAAGRWPRAEATTGALLAPVPPVLELVPRLPPEIAEVIDQALLIDPDQRPSAADFADALAGVTSTQIGRRMAERPSVRASQPVMLVPPPGTPAPAGATYPGAAVLWARWKSLAVAIVAVILLIGVLAALGARCGGGGEAEQPSWAPQLRGHTIEVATPNPMPDRKAAKEWQKVVETLKKKHFLEAKKRVRDWERKWIETPETRSLRQQLDALPPESLRPRGDDDDD